ncbi:hypothetical protein, partial [Sinorhizobium fredii]|uniref:hypothetical protein n=1 Tax=Rhizobium fredii TaxID=380 RepID=UPI001AEC1CAC
GKAGRRSEKQQVSCSCPAVIQRRARSETLMEGSKPTSHSCSFQEEAARTKVRFPCANQTSAGGRPSFRSPPEAVRSGEKIGAIDADLEKRTGASEGPEVCHIGRGGVQPYRRVAVPGHDRFMDISCDGKEQHEQNDGAEEFAEPFVAFGIIALDDVLLPIIVQHVL